MQPISNSKQVQVKFTVTAQRIQNALNENRSHLGSRLAKIGTDNDEAVRDILSEQLSQFHHHKARYPPFNV